MELIFYEFLYWKRNGTYIQLVDKSNLICQMQSSPKNWCVLDLFSPRLAELTGFRQQSTKQVFYSQNDVTEMIFSLHEKRIIFTDVNTHEHSFPHYEEILKCIHLAIQWLH